MKIERKEKNMIEFEDVNGGEVFIYDNRIYLRLAEILSDDSDETFNAVDLADGTCVYFDLYEDVQVIEAILHIKE